MSPYFTLVRTCALLVLSTGFLIRSVSAGNLEHGGEIQEIRSGLKELRRQLQETNRKNDELFRKNDELFRKNDELVRKNDELIQETNRKNDELVRKNDELIRVNEEIRSDLEDVRRFLGTAHQQDMPRRLDDSGGEAYLSCINKTASDAENIYFDGCNVHVRNGEGSTDAARNGRGNLIVGYNKARKARVSEDGSSASSKAPKSPRSTRRRSLQPGRRMGSHNLVVGDGHEYSSYGGVVTGLNNAIYNMYGAVIGGNNNEANGDYSAVFGGQGSDARGLESTVAGGYDNTAEGWASTVSGGESNAATGESSSVSEGNYLSALAKYAKKNQDGPLIEPIASLKSIVLSNEILNDNVQNMFINAYKYWKLTSTPLSTFKNMPATFDIFLQMLNGIMKTAPAFYTVSDTDLSPAGLIAFPINAILALPMATPQGYAVFSNPLINQQLKKILSHWSTFLVSPNSTYVFYSKTHNLLNAPLIPWFSPDGKKQMLDVAFQYTGNNAPSGIEFCDIYVCPNPTNKKTYGFPHWDAFFIKNFAPDIRPLGGPLNPTRWNPSSDDVILNACESAPLSEPVEDVQMSNRFWYKEQWYSLSNILDADDKRAKSFAGGTVYQAFLSGLSYHRWHSPVRGIVTKTKIVSGSYYLGNKYEGFYPDSSMPPDFEGPNLSQKFISAVATRAIMYIQGPAPVGLMAFVAIGMAEVSSCEFFVKEGDTIQKGQEIGAFHYGGSTHLLIFQRNVKLQWVDFNKMYHTGEPGLNSTNVPVNASIARVKV